MQKPTQGTGRRVGSLFAGFGRIVNQQIDDYVPDGGLEEDAHFRGQPAIDDESNLRYLAVVPMRWEDAVVLFL